MTMNCPCGSGRDHAECCGPYLSGADLPPTAEALMRSRYAAYCHEAIGYLHDTSAAPIRRDFSRVDAARWAREATFTRLQVLATEAGGPDDPTGVVDFAATYEQGGKTHVLRERAAFSREGGAWRYAGGTKGQTVHRDQPKVGRNDPCPCGSGKKSKKCCG
jgi:SEC-C motif-containing protein